MKANLTQHAALMENRFTEDNDIEDESWRVSNPCAFDFLFYGVRTGSYIIMLVFVPNLCVLIYFFRRYSDCHERF